MRKSVIGIMTALAFTVTSAALANAPQAPSGRPNIILCMADDQGWGDVAYNGHPVLKTPNLDRMAAAGLRFDRFYAAAPVCSPTRGSVMTGRHPNRFGCFSWGDGLRPQEHTLAEALRSAGYVTGHFGKWHLGPVETGSPVNPGASGFDEWLSSPNFFDNDPILSREGIAVPMKGESSMVTMDAALEFVRKHADGKQPFFAVVWFGSPHVPHEAVEEDRALYEDQPQRLQHFYGEITGLDRAVGKLRDELQKLEIHENTLVWYCSDNGGLPKVGSTGGRGKKADIYEGGLRVPAIIEWPARIDRPRTTALPANTCDIYPTLLELVEAEPPSDRPLDGISLAPAIEGPMTTRPQPMGFWSYPSPGTRTPSKEWMAELLEAQKQGRQITSKERLRLDAGRILQRYPDDTFPGHAAWLDWPWKLHRIQAKDGTVTLELYNLDADPQESEDVSARQAARVKKMRANLEKWLASVVTSLNGEDYTTAYSNPIIERIGLADPHVIRHGGTYYLYPTWNTRSYDVFVSEDLIHWDRKGKCYRDSRRGLWAPDVFHNVRGDGKFYLYYTVNDPDGDKLIGVAVADDPVGPFADRRTLVRHAIDAHMFQDDDGELYLYYVDTKPGYNRILVQPMADPLRLTGEPTVVIEPTDPWERQGAAIAEGPWMLEHNGLYYLMYSGSPANGPYYAIGYATSELPVGPFTKHHGNPIAQQGNGVFGPGHHCVVTGPDGRLWMVYHQQNTDAIGWKRFLAIDPIWFDENGIIHTRLSRGQSRLAQ